MLAIVIPVRNERESIGALLTRFESAMAGFDRPYRIVAVDGVSTDGTAEIVESFGDRLPVEVLRLERNLGLGGALEEGLLAVLERAEVIVTMDGDDSHDPATVHAMLGKLEEGFDLVVASRFEPGGAEIGVAGYRKLLSHSASGVLRFLFPVGSVKDYSSGFRAYRTEALERVRVRFGRLVAESGFSCMMELLLKLRATGARAAEVPLVLRYDLKLSPSKMNILHTIARYAVVIGKNLPTARGLNRASRRPAA